MKKNRTTLIMVLFFFMGLLVLLYPSLSSYYNTKKQSAAIVDYEALLKDFDVKDYSEWFKKAEDFNLKLGALKNPLYSSKTIEGYDNILNVDGNGMMGYISIDKIKVELPIYHGTSESVLSKAAGHIEGTSFPVGGTGTHSALSAHRGLPSATLFTHLDKLEIGDTFTITILDRELVYQIDKIRIVDPDEIDELEINKDEDYVTLVTCTPYGINTHRLLVRGKRIENNEKEVFITTEAFRVSNLVVTPMVALPIIFTLLLIILFTPVKKQINVMEYIYPNKTKGGIKDDKKKN